MVTSVKEVVRAPRSMHDACMESQEKDVTETEVIAPGRAEAKQDPPPKGSAAPLIKLLLVLGILYAGAKWGAPMLQEYTKNLRVGLEKKGTESTATAAESEITSKSNTRPEAAEAKAPELAVTAVAPKSEVRENAVKNLATASKEYSAKASEKSGVFVRTEHGTIVAKGKEAWVVVVNKALEDVYAVEKEGSLPGEGWVKLTRLSFSDDGKRLYVYFKEALEAGGWSPEQEKMLEADGVEGRFVQGDLRIYPPLNE